MCPQIYLCSNNLSWFIVMARKVCEISLFLYIVYVLICLSCINVFSVVHRSTSKSLGLSFQRLLLLWGVELFFTNHLFKIWDSILLTSSHTIWFLLFYFVLFSFRHWSIFSSFKLLCIPVINWWMLGAHHVFHIKFPASLGVMWQPPWMLKTRCLHFV